MNNLSDQEILRMVADHPKQKVKVAVTDIDGVLRGKYMHKKKFLSAAQDSFGFCSVVLGWDSSDVCYDDVAFTGLHTGFHDTPAKIDLQTYRQVPWEDNVPFFLGEFLNHENQPLDICPRQILKGVLKRLTANGFVAKVGMEFEWFNFKETPQSLADKDYTGLTPLTPGMFGYSILRAGQNRDFFSALMDEMEAYDIPLEGLHTETGPGVLEAAIMFGDALPSADRAVLFKTSAKEIGHRFGIMPTFMAKPSANLPGCSGHIHQSLWDLNQESNLFYQDNDPLKMSPVFRHYLAGQLHCLPYLLPFYAPTINSYKRLVEGYWAPTRPTWGVDNRTTAFRLIAGSAKSTRVEVRISGSDVNPYLAMAASLASGLYGIQHNLELPNPTLGNAYAATQISRLPSNLYEATESMVNSEIPGELLGKNFIEHYAQTRFWEWKQFQKAVTDWETQRYFEII